MTDLNLYILLFIIYLCTGARLMNKFRREELKKNPPWGGKTGFEREASVFGEIMVTPLVLLIRSIVKLFTSQQSKVEDQK